VVQLGFDVALLNSQGKGYTNAAGNNPGISGIVFQDMPGPTPGDAGVSGSLALYLKEAVDDTGDKFTAQVYFPENYSRQTRQPSSPGRPMPAPVARVLTPEPAPSPEPILPPGPEPVPLLAGYVEPLC
jgi:hypothetical protein